MKPFLLIKLSNPKKPEEKVTGIIKNCPNVQFKVADSVALSEKGFIRDHLKTVYTASNFIINTSHLIGGLDPSRLTVNDMILSKSMTGAMWKSNTKYWKYFNIKEEVQQSNSHLVVVRTVGRLFDRRPLLGIADLDTDHGVHVEAGQLASLYHSDADLVVLGLQSVVPGAPRLRPEGKGILNSKLTQTMPSYHNTNETELSYYNSAVFQLDDTFWWRSSPSFWTFRPVESSLTPHHLTM